MPFHRNFCSSVDSPSFIVTEFPSQGYILNQITVCVVNCVLIIPALILNGVCILTIFKSPILNGKLCFYLIMVQSVVDLVVVAIAVPSFTYIIYSEVIGTANCVVIFVLSTLGLIPGGLSLAALCALTFERYMSVLHPIAHRNNLSKKKFLIYLCAFTLVLSIGVPIASKSAIAYYAGMVSVIGVSLLLNAIGYTKILIGVHKRFKAANNSTNNSVESNTSDRSERRRFSRESRIARSCLTVVGVFYICYLPGLVLSLYYVQSDKLKYRIAHSWYTTNFTLNASINSLIFFWKRPILRKEASKILKQVFF